MADERQFSRLGAVVITDTLMGRLRQTKKDFPPYFYEKNGRYYFGRENTALGGDLQHALLLHAELYQPKTVKAKAAKAARIALKCPLCGHTDRSDAHWRSNQRAIANMSVRRGKLVRQPCEKCGAEPAEKAP